ncbi:MAG: M24 family metallopeptidase [Bacillota bacterium]
MFPAEEYADRRARLAEELAFLAVDLAVLTHETDLFYFSGTTQASYLFLHRSGRAWLAARRGGFRARGETSLPVEEFKDLDGLLNAIRRHAPAAPRRIGFSFEVLRYEQALCLRSLFPQAEPVDLGIVLRRLRRRKSPRECEYIRLAARQADGAVKTAASLLRTGQTELELSIRIEAYLRRKGHPGVIRFREGAVLTMGFIVGGAEVFAPERLAFWAGPGLSPAVPCGPGDRPFAPHEPVFLQYFGSSAGYLALAARSFSLGPPSSEAGWAYEAMGQVLRQIEQRLGPGEQADKIFAAALRTAHFLGYEGYFLGIGGGPIWPLGHGLGLEADEAPFFLPGEREVLQPGMVVAVAPKVFLPGIGLVGIGNTYLITPNGRERLTEVTDEWRAVPLD